MKIIKLFKDIKLIETLTKHYSRVCVLNLLRVNKFRCCCGNYIIAYLQENTISADI